ncbi:DUF6625 family protein [Bacillus sp. OTU2372]|uniref:DUF6625 family protein n=1 Tax=Bacillus sp. OTU2372 TaxID=3043858 RepID=UPI00313EC10C
MKKCIFILPYFGEFNNYFELFLKSCSYNHDFDWLIITDNLKEYSFPPNVYLKYMDFQEFKRLISSKFDFKISLDKPYKLCDFKPAYGYIFENFIQDYQYWGHCDCDLIFGDLKKFLFPLFEIDYDKIFAVGHLTLYKNNSTNNRMFMQRYKNKTIYRTFFATSEIGGFDEDFFDENVHSIFLENGASIYQEDLSINPAVNKARFELKKYNPKIRKFIDLKFKDTLYVWDNGKIKAISQNPQSNKLICQEYLYMHFQMRKMKITDSVKNANLIQIVPNRFKPLERIPDTLTEWRIISKSPVNMHLFDLYSNKIKRKIQCLIKNY